MLSLPCWLGQNRPIACCPWSLPLDASSACRASMPDSRMGCQICPPLGPESWGQGSRWDGPLLGQGAAELDQAWGVVLQGESSCGSAGLETHTVKSSHQARPPLPSLPCRMASVTPADSLSEAGVVSRPGLGALGDAGRRWGQGTGGTVTFVLFTTFLPLCSLQLPSSPAPSVLACVHTCAGPWAWPGPERAAQLQSNPMFSSTAFTLPATTRVLQMSPSE